MFSPSSRSDRAVSVAITHVLTIGITTVLISGLLIGAGSLLESETERSAERSLETVGERLSNEVSGVNRLGADNDSTVTLTAKHPSTVASSQYMVELREDCGEDPFLSDDQPCLYLYTQGANADVYVPIDPNIEIDDDNNSASGGLIEIRYDPDEEQISLESDR